MKFAVFKNLGSDWSFNSAIPVGLFEAETEEAAEEKARADGVYPCEMEFCAVALVDEDECD